MGSDSLSTVAQTCWCRRSGIQKVRVPAHRYVPNRQLAFEYPDAYPEPEVSIANDANILARPEREAPAAPPASFSLRERFERE